MILSQRFLLLSCENLQPEFFGKRKSCVRGRSTHTILISYPSPTRIFSSTPTISAFTQQLKACLSFQQLSFQTIAGLLKYSFVHIIPFAQKRTLNLYHLCLFSFLTTPCDVVHSVLCSPLNISDYFLSTHKYLPKSTYQLYIFQFSVL